MNVGAIYVPPSIKDALFLDVMMRALTTYSNGGALLQCLFQCVNAPLRIVVATVVSANGEECNPAACWNAARRMRAAVGGPGRRSCDLGEGRGVSRYRFTLSLLFRK
jgi:hypothetical protein